MKKKVGFFGGTFDPIHFGHINLAIEIQEKHHLEKILFCPANYSPAKKHLFPLIEGKHRKEMIIVGIEGIPQFALTSIELDRTGPSYTIDSIRTLKKQYPDTDFFLVLGEDMLADFSQWKEVEELVKLARPLIGTRLKSKPPSVPELLREQIMKGMTVINSMEISSTELRQRLKKRLFCGHLIPTKVLDYIYKHHLYL